MNRLALIVPLVAFPALAHADLIFALNSPAAGGGIYLVDTATGASTLYRATPTNNASFGGNGLAYDASSDTFYYVIRPGGNDQLIRSTPSGETNLGALLATGPINSATFHNGAYWYHPNNEARVYSASFPTPSTISSTFQVLPNFPAISSFGDIASLPDGTTYASYSGDMRRYNLNNISAGAVPLAAATTTMQLAFYGTNLWGISGNDRIYSVNTATGASTLVATLQNTSLTIVDAATVPAPAAGLILGVLPLVRRRRR